MKQKDLRRIPTMKRIYPVIFTQTNDGILIEVPDMDIVTEAKDMTDAIDMARDAIGLKGITLEDSGQDIPQASAISQIRPENGAFFGEGESYTSLVDIDYSAYRKMVDNRVIKKSISLPSWLNKKAESAGINFSKTLQDALIELLDIKSLRP